jgi:hypothetical protein
VGAPVKRIVSFIMVGALVAILVAASASSVGASVPPALVGLWKGGSHSNGLWYYEFSADGDYRTWPESTPDVVNAGTVAVDDRTIAFSNGGAPITVKWSVSDDVLLLDEQRYVRA